jgi:thioredoxin reductase
LAEYPGFELWPDEVLSLQSHDGVFSALLGGARRAEGLRVVLATGVSDPLPELPGLAERWGRSVPHCPYCHGYEIGGGPIGVLATAPTSLQQASLLADWGQVTLFSNGHAAPDATACILLARRKVLVESVAVRSLEGEGAALEAARLRLRRHAGRAGGAHRRLEADQRAPRLRRRRRRALSAEYLVRLRRRRRGRHRRAPLADRRRDRRDLMRATHAGCP